MSKNLGFLIGLLSFVLFVVGCGPPWTVIKQADPNPFNAQSKVDVQPPSFDGMHIGGKTEQEYLAGKDAETAGKFTADKQGMIDGFMAGFQDKKDALTMAQGQYVVKPTITYVEPGFYAAVAAGATEVRADVKIFDEKGGLVDEIVIKTRQGADMYHPSSGQRMRNCAEDIGKITAKYLKTRAGLN